MIKNFTNPKLQSVWTGDGVDPIPTSRVREILYLLDLLHVATMPADIELPAYRLEHRGEDSNNRPRFAVTIPGQWCISFSWQDGDAHDVDFEDFR